MDKYVKLQCKRVVVKHCLGSAALTLSLLSLGMAVPQSVEAANNTASTREVVPEQRQYHVRFINEKGEVMIEEDLLGTPGECNNFSKQLSARLDGYTDNHKKNDQITYWKAPKKGNSIEIKVYPRIDLRKTCRDVEFQLKCHFDDRPMIEKPVTLSYYAEILYNHVTHKETLSFMKIADLYQTLVIGDKLILPNFEGYKLSPKSVTEVKTTGILTTPQDFENSSTPKLVGPFDLYFIHQDSTAGSGTTTDQGKPGDSHQEDPSTDVKKDNSTQTPDSSGHQDAGSQTDKGEASIDTGSQTDDQVSDAGSQTDSPASSEEQTQTDKSESHDESAQTDHHESQDDSSQTDRHKSRDDSSQTDAGHDRGTQTDDTSTGEDGTQTDNVNTDDDATQTDQQDKKDDGSQTDRETNDEGTQTDQTNQDDEGTETDISKGDDSTQTEDTKSQDSANQTESIPTKDEGSQTNTRRKQDSGSQTEETGTSQDSSQTDDTITKDDVVQTDDHKAGIDAGSQTEESSTGDGSSQTDDNSIDTGSQTGSQEIGTDSSVQTDGDAVTDEGTQTSGIVTSDQASQTDASKQDDAATQTASSNNAEDAGTQTAPQDTSDESTSTDLSSAEQIDVKKKENIEQHVDRPSQDEHAQVKSADRTDAPTNAVANAPMPTPVNQSSSEGQMLDSVSQPLAKDSSGASDLEKINELNQLPLNTSADKNDELPQTGGHGFLASLLGMIMAAVSLCGIAKRHD